MTSLDTLYHNLYTFHEVANRVFAGKFFSVISGVLSAGGICALLHFLPGAWVIPVHLGLKELIFISIAAGFATTSAGIIGTSLYERTKTRQISLKKFREAIEKNEKSTYGCHDIFQVIFDNNNQNNTVLSKFICVLGNKYGQIIELTTDEKKNVTPENLKKLKSKEKKDLLAKQKHIDSEINVFNHIFQYIFLPNLLTEMATKKIQLNSGFIDKCLNYIEKRDESLKHLSNDDLAKYQNSIKQTNERMETCKKALTELKKLHEPSHL